MTRCIILLFAIGLVLVGCSSDIKNSNNEKNTSVVSGDSSTDSSINTEITPSIEQNVLQDSPVYVAKREGKVIVQDSETAYEMCVKALIDYYKRSGTVQTLNWIHLSKTITLNSICK